MAENVYEVESLVLQCGATLPNARLVYKTHGRLNGKKDNVILFPTWFCVHHLQLEWLIGEGLALDPSQYFIVTVNILGNGMSSSPSNTRPPFDRGRFPAISILDNVKFQSRMLSDVWGIEKVALVIGRSMGAQLAFQWASYFPERVDRMLAIAGSARTSPHNYIFLAAVKAAIMIDPVWAKGEYVEQPAAGLELVRLIYDGWVLSQEFYRQNLHLVTGYGSTKEFLERKVDGVPRDANNVLAQINTWQHADISANDEFQRNFENALGAITARSIVMPSRTDLYFPPEDSEYEVSKMPNAELRVIPSIWGHRAGAPGGDPSDIRFVNEAIRELLSAK